MTYKCMRAHFYNPNTRERRQEGQTFKIILSYLENSRLAWATIHNNVSLRKGAQYQLIPPMEKYLCMMCYIWWWTVTVRRKADEAQMIQVLWPLTCEQSKNKQTYFVKNEWTTKTLSKRRHVSPKQQVCPYDITQGL